MISAEQALERLRTGNRRFVAGEISMRSVSPQAREELAEGQAPFAVILGCSDSRVPVEIVFDQGLGDLFVIRVAGNIIAPSLIGSVEFAAERFGTRLVVVMGHTGCGAVQATIEELQRPAETRSRNLIAIVDRIRPAVESLLLPSCRHDPESLSRAAVRANIHSATADLRRGSELLEGLIRNGGLRVIGAEYSLETGCVEFFDGNGAGG